MERRKYNRAISASHIDFYDVGGTYLCEGSVLNISTGGIFVAYIDKNKLSQFIPHQKIKFTFNIPTGQLIGNGEIVWLNEEELSLGLKFTAIENEDGISHLIDFITSPICGWRDTETGV
ncbi:MAG: PilZ domain-containing protein [Candidatus Omnitrophica bacterium]|nr:PilZ domain-containing protein [Candidatus Omnitrophota bacterium]